MENKDIYTQTKEEILKVGKKFKLDKDKLEDFLQPDKILEVKIPVKTKGNKTKIYKGYRSQHNNKLGPYKGGIRYHQDVTKEEVKALSLWMSLKCAIANIPFGGGKGGIVVNPKELSEAELEALSRGYTRKIYEIIGPSKDVPAPDVNTNAKIMKWMTDEYIKIANAKEEKANEILYATFTGKPIDYHGLEGREEATGYGGVVILQELIKKLGLDKKTLTIAIQGFGNVGFYFAKFASDLGYKIIALSDSKGAILKTSKEEESFDIPLVLECKKKQGMLAGCYCTGGVCDIKKGKIMTNEELLELPVDVLVPAALENVINEKNMHKIKAKIIIEMANGPITPNAFNYLSKKGIIIVPDILANSGGVTGSYIEWVQNIENKKYKKEEVFMMLEKIMKKAFSSLWKAKEKYKTNLKEASYVYAIKKIIG